MRLFLVLLVLALLVPASASAWNNHYKCHALAKHLGVPPGQMCHR